MTQRVTLLASAAALALVFLAPGCGGSGSSSDQTITLPSGQAANKSKLVDFIEEKAGKEVALLCSAMNSGQGDVIRPPFEKGIEAAFQGKEIPISPGEIFEGITARC
jgi:hypothetical protein